LLGKPSKEVYQALRILAGRPEFETVTEWLQSEITRLHNENASITDELQWRRNQGGIKTVQAFIQRTEEAPKALR